ncbi:MULTISPECIES: MATE family efflux transporter [Actinomyces]|uniref:Multi antimicrobial extrusion protein n=1 Tax=Actinomyces glycerinitolerans TaxID=1892869 RepID=A0A1M4RVV9_9ACTO|nr:MULTISPECIES: MATE family efflux transporter [Actinomyces]RAX21216.1 MATE family efflux transporter [Actinomyces sp. Z3]SHE24132.1 multi antimicrobial extrusion protein [Actinomyces glycerinitolerans]
MDMSQHLGARALLRFTAPSIAMMLFTSIYGVVDGLFVANFAGKTALAAITLIMPFIMILGTLGFMMGSGGSELISHTRGRGHGGLANRYFSMIVYVTLGTGIVLAAVGALTMRPVAQLLGASGQMLELCVLYGRILMVSLPAFMLQYAFQTFASTAGRPRLGLYVTVAAGMTNMALDLLFVGVFGWGVAGAAWATVASELIGGLVPLAWFARPNSSFLRLGRPVGDLAALGRVCVNGSSEMMAVVAISVVSIIYNLQLLRFMGPDGVAAYGVVMYVSMIFTAVFEGFCMGAAPLMSYQHGAANDTEKRSLMRTSLAILAITGAMMLLASQLLAHPLALIFAANDRGLMELTETALRIFSVAFLPMGVSMYGSSLFTALGNGLVSAALAAARTLGLEVGSVLLLPLLIGPAGIWAAIIVAETTAALAVGVLIRWLGPRYGLRDRRPFPAGQMKKSTSNALVP